jgi:predicted nucleotidyltransferase
MRLHPNVIPPMNFQELLEGIELGAKLTSALNALLLAKSRSKEIGIAPIVSIVDDFIMQEFEWAREAVKTISTNRPNLTMQADALFRRIIA